MFDNTAASTRTVSTFETSNVVPDGMLLTAAGLVLQVASADGAGAKLVRDARAAQSRFEGIRRMHMPRDRTGGSGGRCDARIGRYCYWYDSTETKPVPEPKRITEARAALIASLDTAAARSPGDAWIQGQRARYLIEGGRANDATAHASACRAERWWCAALAGLALHVAERYVAAESAFAVALGEMPAPQRCEWTDVRLLVNDRLARELSRTSCDERARLGERLWTLSQPLWSTPANDLRTEHFARLTMAHILARSANAHGMSFGADSRELMLRYGWTEWYTRDDPTPGLSMSPGVIGHDREPSYAFIPEMSSLRTVPRLTPASWRLREAAARARYAPRHIKGASVLPHQLVRFPRHDSMLVAVAFSIGDTALARDSVAAHLAVYANSALRVSERPRSSREDRGAVTMTVTVPRDTVIASIEAVGEVTRRMARARYTVEPLPCDASRCVSDLLLFDGSGGANADIDRALSRAITTKTFSVQRPLGVHWEIQGIPEGDPAWLSLTIVPARISLARRVATRLHLAAELTPVRLRWQATVLKEHHAQSVTLRLPPNARGVYRVVLTVEPAGRSPLTTSREIELVP